MYFAQQQEAACDMWLRASEVYEFKVLPELIVLEQLKQSLLKVMQTHSNNRNVQTLSKAAQAAETTSSFLRIHGVTGY